MNILFLSGSNRKNSFNTKLSNISLKIANDMKLNGDFLDLSQYQLPIYNEDLESQNGLPDEAVELKKIFEKYDCFFISSPEYNGFISPMLKNVIDWTSRAVDKDEKPLSSFFGKKSVIASASPGKLGGIRGLLTLRMLLNNIGVTVFPGQLCIGEAFKAFDDKGNLTDDDNINILKNILNQFSN